MGSRPRQAFNFLCSLTHAEYDALKPLIETYRRLGIGLPSIDICQAFLADQHLNESKNAEGNGFDLIEAA